MGRTHTKPVVVVEVVVVVTDRTAHVESAGPTAPKGAAKALYLLPPATQNLPDLYRDFGDMLILTHRDEFQINAHANVNLQLPQPNIGLLQVARLFDSQPSRNDLLLKFKGFVLNPFGKYKTLVFGEFLRGGNEPHQHIVGFGEDG